MTRRITLKPSSYEIEIQLDDFGSGSITSDLKDDEIPKDAPYNILIDGLETLLLSLAVTGLNMDDSKVKEAIEATLETISLNYLD